MKKAGSRWKLNPGHLPCAASALPLTYDSWTTTNPHNPLYILHRWYQSHTRQPLSVCSQKSVRDRLENSLLMERILWSRVAAGCETEALLWYATVSNAVALPASSTNQHYRLSTNTPVLSLVRVCLPARKRSGTQSWIFLVPLYPKVVDQWDCEISNYYVALPLQQ